MFETYPARSAGGALSLECHGTMSFRSRFYVACGIVW